MNLSWEGVGLPVSWDLLEWLMSPCWAEGALTPLLWLCKDAVLLGCWSTSPCSALAVSVHPGSRNLAGAGRSIAAATYWAGVVLPPLLFRQLITTEEPLMLA